MFKNYFKTAIRNLLRYKGFSFINILSLAIGITGCLAIGLFVRDEKQFDNWIPEGENVYRLYDERTDNNNNSYSAVVAPAYSQFLQRTYPEVDTTTRMMMIRDKYLVELGEKRGYEDKGRFVDPSFFDVFPIEFLKGDRATSLTTPMSIVLSEDIAERYFGSSDPIGKTIFVDKDTFEVKGVFASLPNHFHLDFNYLMPISSLNLPVERMQAWGWHQFYTYIKLKPGADVAQLQEKFQEHMKREVLPDEVENGSSFLPFFQRLQDIHLNSADFVYDNAIRGNITYVKGLTIIALFVLIIACFNFINLATARSFRRAKEIGVRKVVGAEKSQLITQFIGETILLSILSLIIAVIATMVLVPFLNQFTGKSIEFNPFSNPLLGITLLLSGILIGIIAGIYPAFVLSGFQPIKVLKNLKLTGTGSSWLRPALVVIQFSLSVLLIISTLLVYRQTKYLNEKDLGFNKDQVVYFQVREDVSEKLETFKAELSKSTSIQSITAGYGLPGDQFAGDGVIIPTKDGDKPYNLNVFLGDHNYLRTLGLQLIAGRDFSKDLSTDATEAFIITETAVKELGYGTAEKAIGQPMYWEEWAPLDTLNPVKKGKVIGVVKDFHAKSLHEKVSAAVIHIYPQVLFKIAVKLKPGATQQGIAHIENIWQQFAPGYPLEYQFMDETFGKMYENEKKLSQLLWIFAIMAIVVGCMGLFGLAAFSAEQRTKEIGIRKVLGASLLNIIGLLSKNFLIMVIIASLIAFPVAWWTMNNWLDNFPYRINISWWVFAVAICTALLIAFITVSVQSIRVAITNPVKSLRTE